MERVCECLSSVPPTRALALLLHQHQNPFLQMVKADTVELTQSNRNVPIKAATREAVILEVVLYIGWRCPEVQAACRQCGRLERRLPDKPGKQLLLQTSTWCMCTRLCLCVCIFKPNTKHNPHHHPSLPDISKQGPLYFKTVHLKVLRFFAPYTSACYAQWCIN